MNIVFWLLIILFLILLWFLLAFMFKPIGKIFLKIFNDAKNEIIENKEE